MSPWAPTRPGPEEGQEPYDLFQADGSYTLELEPDAFFPYEVQFTHDGQTQQVWFMDPEDTVDVGGHTFSVESSVSDPAAITEMTFTAGARPLWSTRRRRNSPTRATAWTP